MVGAGVLNKQDTHRTTSSVLPTGIKRIKGAIATFTPKTNSVNLEDGNAVSYQ